MGEIIQEEKHEKGGKRRPKKHSTSIDMTPMVDLMCLLITFFMLTTAFSKPKVMEITMPEKTEDTAKPKDAPKVAADRTVNVLITGEDELYYYIGLANPNEPPLPTMMKTNYGPDGLRKFLLERNANVFKQVTELKEKVIKGELVVADSTLNRMIREIKKSDKKSPIVLIKADEKAKYKHIVDVIDEMAICNIAQYAVVDIAPIEIKMLESVQQ
ncbi:MAG TPA: biopolymer transporter ExbD [Bacteroidales bacterium]|nr:biopolymer transporter ExbD [Bacteroidales bacterium]HSA42138.1 biopolymer transporter ExbD [Bacteroidales bacterium]